MFSECFLRLSSEAFGGWKRKAILRLEREWFSGTS